MTDLFNSGPTITEQIAELQRERKMREFVYPNLVRTKKLTQRKADWQLACLDAAIATLEGQTQ